MVSPTFIKPWLPKNGNPKYLLTDGNLVDPTNGHIYPQSSVYIDDGVIVSVATNGAAISDVPSNDKDIVHVALDGKYLCPGLIDSHVHICAVPGEMDFSKIMAMPEQQVLLRMTFVCRDMLTRGFTTVRDCGGAPYALKQACDEWLAPGPRLFLSGHAISQTGGHGDFRNAHDHTPQTECCAGMVSGLGRICDGVPACLATARDELRCGADFLKIMGSGGVVSPSDSLENLQFSPEEIQAFVRVANNAHTYVTCHAYSPEAIRHAIDNGVRGIEHGNLLDKETAERMAELGCYLTPTLVTFHSMAVPEMEGFLNTDSAAKNKDVLAMGLQALQIAKDAGVPMCYGSDLLGPLGTYQSGEFALRSAVLSPLDILQSATVTPAKMLGQETKLGQIRPGFAADLLVLKSNPLKDITVLERSQEEILAVFKGGRVCSSKTPDLQGILDKLRDM